MRQVFVMISISTGKLRGKIWFFSFSSIQNEKNLWTKLGKQIGENI
jgi:hypothetical protein